MDVYDNDQENNHDPYVYIHWLFLYLILVVGFCGWGAFILSLLY